LACASPLPINTFNVTAWSRLMSNRTIRAHGAVVALDDDQLAPGDDENGSREA
jgi:hypothetical protein